MNRYVKIKFNGKQVPYWLHYIDDTYIWSSEQIKSENAKSVELAKMAFLDHGTPKIPIDSIELVFAQKAAYLNRVSGTTFLVYEGGSFMTLLPQMEITESVFSNYFPIQERSAIVCENDPFDKHQGGLDHVFLSMAKKGGAESFHYMFNFKNRLESEIIEAFKSCPAIVFWSSHTEIEWWELMLRCIIKSKTEAKVIGYRPKDQWPSTLDLIKRMDICVDLANKFGVNIEYYS